LAYLAFTEAWERFSFFGMQTLLMFYMVGELLLPGHVDKVLGFPILKAGLFAVFGPMSTIGLASMIFGLYSAFAYFLPVFGGAIGDRYLGQRRSVMLGAVLMAIGHFLMAFEAPFLLALMCLILGSGFLKGNINTQVGRLYAPQDRRRTEAYQVFSIGVNVGGVLAPFVCGTLGEKFGWHYGFAAAGVGMLIGLVIYLAGQRYLPPDRIRDPRAEKPRLQPGDGRVMAALLVVLVVITAYLTSIGQTASIYLLWVKSYANLKAFGFAIPATWLLSATSLGSMLLTPPIMRFWRWQAVRGAEPGLLTKIGVGAGIACLACLLLAAVAFQARCGVKIALAWLLLFHLMVTFAYLYLWPVGLALFSRAAPTAVNATFIGIYFLSSFVSNIVIGWLGRFYETMTPAGFWLMQAAIGAAGALMVLVLGAPLSRILKPRDAPAAASQGVAR
jgi:POT family proton-dependent oligopeptide transporter